MARNKMKAARQRLNLSQAKLAERLGLGVTPSQISRFELGYGELSLNVQEKLAQLLELRVTDLSGANDEPAGNRYVTDISRGREFNEPPTLDLLQQAWDDGTAANALRRIQTRVKEVLASNVSAAVWRQWRAFQAASERVLAECGSDETEPASAYLESGIIKITGSGPHLDPRLGGLQLPERNGHSSDEYHKVLTRELRRIALVRHLHRFAQADQQALTLHEQRVREARASLMREEG